MVPVFFSPESFQNMASMQGQRLQKEEPIALERLVAVDWWAGGIVFFGKPWSSQDWTCRCKWLYHNLRAHGKKAMYL